MKRIFLIGYMGAGKTTLGKALANYLSYEFIDLDWYIEDKIGQSIPSFFVDFGEAAFREIEHKSLVDLLEKERVIIATGGGAPCYFNNMDLMLKSGIVVFLEASQEILFTRLKDTLHLRPVLRSKTEDELRTFIASSLANRAEYYNRATYVINTNHLESEEEIRQTINVFLKTLNI